MEGIFLLLGSNLGDRAKVLEKAIESMEGTGIKILKRSSVYETAAWGITDQQAFLNQVIEISTSLKAVDLLDLILQIEIDLGRVRKRKWGERLIDIDLLYYGDQVLDLEHLKVPHPGIPARKFTLIPLVEISPSLIHPEKGISQVELLENCSDNLNVTLYTDI